MQLSGYIACQLCQYAFVFVDHHSDFTYLHILKTQDGYEAVKSREAFESYAEYHDVNTKHYHSDNGISGVHDG